MRGDEYIAKTADGVVITTFAPFDETLRKELREKINAQNKKFLESTQQLESSGAEKELLKINYKRSDDGQAWLGALTTWIPLLLLV